MESYDFLDTIKPGKANAFARYSFTNVTKYFQVLELFVAIAFISWSSFRLPFLYNFFFTFSSYLTNQHFIFVLGNIIVIICYFLSRQPNSSITVTITEPVNPGTQHSNVPDLVPEIQVPVIKAMIPTEMVIKKAAKQIEKFQRTQSEKLKSEICVKSRKKLRRSVTEKKKQEQENSVERLSNEEFRIAVEAFISKQQTFLKQQSIMVQDE